MRKRRRGRRVEREKRLDRRFFFGEERRGEAVGAGALRSDWGRVGRTGGDEEGGVRPAQALRCSHHLEEKKGRRGRKNGLFVDLKGKKVWRKREKKIVGSDAS